jgi:hypothetical protein
LAWLKDLKNSFKLPRVEGCKLCKGAALGMALGAAEHEKHQINFTSEFVAIKLFTIIKH